MANNSHSPQSPASRDLDRDVSLSDVHETVPSQTGKEQNLRADTLDGHENPGTDISSIPGLQESSALDRTSVTAEDVGEAIEARQKGGDIEASQSAAQNSQPVTMEYARGAARTRTESESTANTNVTRSTINRGSARSSMVFVTSALESIAASKDARKRKALLESTQRALSAIRDAQGDHSELDPEIIFEPLSLATEATGAALITTALDCIGKLISFSYFSLPLQTGLSQDVSSPKTPLIERAIDAICECFQGETTPTEVQMQIIKSLLAAILNDKIVVHGAGLLKSIRQTYNIFLLSKSSANQQIAQGTLTQMVNTVFERVKIRMSLKSGRQNTTEDIGTQDPADQVIAGPDTPGGNGEDTPISMDAEQVGNKDAQPMTLQSFETRKSFDDGRITDSAPTTISRNTSRPTLRNASRTFSDQDVPSITVQAENTSVIVEDDEEEEVFIRDAFLVFRAMCKLSTKALRADEAADIRSQGLRSKLLSLHTIHTLLFNHPLVFTSSSATIRNSSGGEPTTFTQAVKQYLCLSLSRNGASNVHKVFEVACEIFWLMNLHLRFQLKRELEVFYKEIYLAIMDKRAAPGWQKAYVINHLFGRIAADSKVLVELYLNYDCDALENIYQRIIEHVQKASSFPVQTTAAQQQAYLETSNKTHPTSAYDWRERGTLPPSLATTSMSTSTDVEHSFPPEYGLKMQALECIVAVLGSMVSWAQQVQGDIVFQDTRWTDGDVRPSTDDLRESIDARDDASTFGASPSLRSAETMVSGTTSIHSGVVEDDPDALELMKKRKTALDDAIRQFNFKPKRGIRKLILDGFIPSADPADIARFMLDNDLINKKSLGEFLGEGDEENIRIMHAFVDQMDFSRTRFVDALRRFLQSFRLPGEAQKIDRLMLKFAERYTSGNPSAFANADTAYVLAYSVIMLNTDQHSAQVKQRMTIEDFIKNNRGINDNANLPDEYLQSIFDEIAQNEIVLDTEREKEANLGASSQTPSGGLMSAIANAGRDLQREAYAQASDKMSSRTEQLFKSMLRAQRRGNAGVRDRFLTASSSRHIGPMFSLTWMSFLTALSGNAQETQTLETIRLCMRGEKLAVRLACLFDLADPRQAFVSSLARHTNLYNLNEMKAKNVEALKTLLEVAFAEGNLLKESWRDILTCISQLDRFQLISSGVEEGAIPDMLRTQSNSTLASAQRRSTQRVPASNLYQAGIAEESRSADMVRIVDRIFTSTANLSGDAIVHFVRALTQVSWQEIQSSGQSESPRTYSLQKLVEISGYNMLRVRFEWTNIWQVLGRHFIDVGCHNNTHVVYFALNSLRQLSMRFLEIEELPGFRFQKDFLKPFELILSNANQVLVKDMVLRCLIQMIQARGDMIRSGWRTMFGVFTVAAREPYETIVNLAFDNVTQVYNDRFGVVISQGAFADLVVCLTEFSKNMRFQKKSLQAIETLKACVPKMLRTPECSLSHASMAEKDPLRTESVLKQPLRQTQEEQYWFPVLFAFHDVLMTGEDLEVRSRALTYLFDTLTKYAGQFPREFWDTLWRQLLYPIFMVLKDRKAINHEAANHEELSVWLSTTLIQALRNMISLFTHFFGGLEYMLDRFLDLLALCICQENDTLARIGSNCLQQLILQNVSRFTPEHWEQIVGAFVDLFSRTEARELFSAAAVGSHRVDHAASAVDKSLTSEPNGHSSGNERDSEASQANGRGGSSFDGDYQDENGIHGPRPSHSHLQTQLDLVEDGGNQHMTASARNRSVDLEDFADVRPQQATVVVTAARRRYFNQIITKCVLQLLMIETVSELFNNDIVYASIPSHLLLRLMALLKKSFHFAKRFNEDRELRTRLFREGFMKQPPNLLKQESGSASVYVLILLRMHADKSPGRLATRSETEAALIPLCQDILHAYISLDEETQQRNIATWRPVVIDVLDGYIAFDEDDFKKHVAEFAPLGVGLMSREMGQDLQRAVQALWQRVCEVQLGISRMPELPMATPTSPRASVFGTRRGSRGR